MSLSDHHSTSTPLRAEASKGIAKRSTRIFRFKIWRLFIFVSLASLCAYWYFSVLGRYDAIVTVTDFLIIEEELQKDDGYAIVALEVQSPYDRQFDLPDGHKDYPGRSLIVTQEQYEWFRNEISVGWTFTLHYSPKQLPGRETITFKDALIRHLESAGAPGF